MDIKNRFKPLTIPVLSSLFVIYLEVVFILSIFGKIQLQGFLSCVFFSIAAGLILAILSSFGPKRFNRLVMILLWVLLAIVFSAQVVYYTIFSSFFSFYSMSTGGKQVMQFWGIILEIMLECWLPILLFLAPVILLIVFGRKRLEVQRTGWKTKTVLAGLVLLTFLGGLLPLQFAGDELYSPRELYYEIFSPALCANEFGLLTTMRLDVRNELFGSKNLIPTETTGKTTETSPAESTVTPTPAPSPSTSETSAATEPTTPEPSFEPNQLAIDFDKLAPTETDPEIQAMHHYFQAVQPTLKNQYTGMFQGKNLILIVAESFTPLVIDKERTPTLYKLSTEGFQFNHFYTPLWPVSTSDGEYTSNLSLIPKDGVWSMTASAKITLPFAMGRMLLNQDYRTFAYHDHSYTFYKRNLSHPNMGYEIFKGVGNGLNITKQWPESDVEMIEASVPEYLGDKPFATYYMTVSGHLEYNKYNAMVRKNWDLVEDLTYSDPVKAYLACNIELDRALEALINSLEAAGQAEDTVIAMSADHYPYGLSNDQISELVGHPVEENFELYQNAFYVWHKGIQKVVVDKPGSSLDIVPTLANLFGLPFDSRLLMGRDMLSDTGNMVIFSNRSWLNSRGSYNTLTRTYTPTTGQPLDKEDLRKICQEVDDRFTYSGLILTKDYYAKLGLAND